MNLFGRFSGAIIFGIIFSIGACSNEQAGQREPDATQIERPDVIATNAFFYYDDVDVAWRFYQDTLGFETVVDYGFAKILRIAESSYLTVVKAEEGMHSADEPKTVVLKLVTDELNRWYEYAVEEGILGLSRYSGGRTTPRNSFIIDDPEGYVLEFVRYNPHPNHDSYVESFAGANPVQSTVNHLGNMSVRATAFTVYYDNVDEVRPFFESLFEVESVGVLDNKPLYHLAGSGFVALQDYPGALPAAPGENGMTLSFLTTDVDAWFDRATSWPGFELRTPEVLNEGGLVRVFVGYDPAGVFLEWDTFLEVPENQALLEHLE